MQYYSMSTFHTFYNVLFIKSLLEDVILPPLSTCCGFVCLDVRLFGCWPGCLLVRFFGVAFGLCFFYGPQANTNYLLNNFLNNVEQNIKIYPDIVKLMGLS